MRRTKLIDIQEDINMLPLLNIIMLLIPFLLMSTAFVRAGIIDVFTPTVIAHSHNEPKILISPLNLTVSIEPSGYRISLRQKWLKSSCQWTEKQHIHATEEHHLQEFLSLSTLQTCLHRIKKRFPTHKKAFLSAKPQIPYEKVIETMDILRKDKEEDLFPHILLLADL